MDVLLNSILPVSKKLLAQRYLQYGDFENCSAYLDSVSLLSEVTTVDEDSLFIELMQVLIDVQEDTVIYGMDSAQRASLEDIATDTITGVGFMAQNILSKVFGHEYEYPVAEIEEGGGGGAKTSKIESINEAHIKNTPIDSWFKIYPNPNSGTMTLEYFLIFPNGTFILYDIWGRIKMELSLEEGFNKRTLEVSDNTGSIYLYKILNNKGDKLHNGRIAVIP